MVTTGEPRPPGGPVGTEEQWRAGSGARVEGAVRWVDGVGYVDGRRGGSPRGGWPGGRWGADAAIGHLRCCRLIPWSVFVCGCDLQVGRGRV